MSDLPVNRRRSPRSMFASSRPGVTAVISVLVLVLLQLVVVAVIVLGTREQDTTINRLDSSRAFYAAEGAMNMGIREMMTYTDDDNDGQSGGISNNNLATDDVTLPPSARALTVRTEASGVTSLTADGRSGLTRRRVSVTIAEGTVPGRRVIYSQWPRAYPQYRIWSGSNWGAAADTLNFGGQQYWAVIRRCPIRQEVAVVCSLQTRDLVAAVQSNTTWGNQIMATSDCGTVDERPFAFAYEQTSGEGLLAYRVEGSNEIFYRTWDGATWSTAQSTASLLSSGATFIKLVPKPGSDEVMLLALASNASIVAMSWNGSSFGSKVLLESAAASGSRECMDAAYERTTGRCMVAWGRAGSTAPQYATFNGAWSTGMVMPDVGGQAHWIHMASDPSSDKLMIGLLDSSGRISANVWSGSGWGTYIQATTTAPSTGSRCFDVCFEPRGTYGLIMYGHSSTTIPRYRTYDGTTWSAQQSAPTLPGTPLLVQMTPSGGGTEIMVLINATGGQNRLEFLRWNGSSFVNSQELEGNVSGPAGAEVFMIPDSPPIQVPQLVRSWAEAQP